MKGREKRVKFGILKISDEIGDSKKLWVMLRRAKKEGNNVNKKGIINLYWLQEVDFLF